MAKTFIAGTVVMDLPADATILRATVRLEDVTLADAISNVIAEQDLSLTGAREGASFCLEVENPLIVTNRQYILTAQAVVKMPGRGREWQFGVTQAHTWPGQPLAQYRLELRPLYALGEQNDR